MRWYFGGEARQGRLRFRLRAMASRWETRPGAKRGHRVDAIRFGALTCEGVLTVAAPEAFRRMLADGLGSARAYGNGMMQIAPAP